MHAGGTRHLCEAADAVLDLAGSRHHQIGELVNGDDNARHLLFGDGQSVHFDDGLHKLALLVFNGRVVLHIFQVFLDQRIVGVDVLAVEFREYLVAVEHFVHSPAQRRRRLFSVGNYRHQQVRNALVL